MADRVLILGGRAPVALDHARRFAAQGWTVFVADSISCRISGWSRAVSGTLRLPSARDSLAAYAKALNDAIRRHRIDLVVPTCEESFYVSRIAGTLPSGLRVTVGDFSTLRTVHSKWEFLALAAGCGAQVPASHLVESIAQAREWAAGSPVVLKPEFSRFGVHVRLYQQGMPADAPAFDVPGRWVAQRFHPGRELCSYSVADCGRLLAHVSYHPAYRLNASSSFLFEPCAAPAIRAFVEKFVRKTGYTGQISFDWIEADGGELTVLECNPRAISGVHLFSRADALPAALAGTADDCVEPNDAAPRMIAAVMLAAGGYVALRDGNLRKWWRDYARAEDVVVTPRDRLPLLGGLVDLVSYAWLARKQHCSLREAATRDTEWDGEPMETP